MRRLGSDDVGSATGDPCDGRNNGASMIGRAGLLVNASPPVPPRSPWRVAVVHRRLTDAGRLEAEVGEQLQISHERVRQIENEALQKLRRLDRERLFAYHQEL